MSSVSKDIVPKKKDKKDRKEKKLKKQRTLHRISKQQLAAERQPTSQAQIDQAVAAFDAEEDKKRFEAELAEKKALVKDLGITEGDLDPEAVARRQKEKQAEREERNKAAVEAIKHAAVMRKRAVDAAVIERDAQLELQRQKEVENAARKRAEVVLRPGTRSKKGEVSMSMVGSVDEYARLFGILAQNEMTENGRILNIPDFLHWIDRLAAISQEGLGHKLRTRAARQVKGMKRVTIYQFKELIQGSLWNQILSAIKPAETLFSVFDTSRDGYIEDGELIKGLISLADASTVSAKDSAGDG